MSKSQIHFPTVIGLIILVLGIAAFTFFIRDHADSQVLPATANRDCAPWDGTAFTMSIPMKNGNIVNISIWQSPDIKFPVTFSFPDETGQIGNAYATSESGSLIQLSGKVSLQPVDGGSPIQGEFDLKDENGNPFKGKFRAEWRNEIVMCG